jgi:hypothetical protein
VKKNFYFVAAGVTFSVAVSFAASQVKPKVIYGEDNRRDVIEVSRADVRDIADSTVALIPNSSLSSRANGVIQIDTTQFGSDMNLCSGEPFFSQPIAAICSGSLVGDDLIATAGHCINASNCKDHSFVFGFKMVATNQAQEKISATEVYKCKDVVAHEYGNGADYALVRLDRPVRGHRVLNLQQNPVSTGDQIYVVGHPSGLPTKVTDGATVREQKGAFFVSNLDTYGGNSGSAVFNDKTNEIVGILVRGEDDFVYDRTSKCYRSKVCPSAGCRGEDATNILYIENALRQAR